MASGWAHFRKVWLKPEVYPLIGAMAAAVGVMTVSLVNMARNPTVGWKKGKRGTGQLFEDVDEVVPFWAGSKHRSTSIFSSDSSIVDSKALGKPDLGTFTVSAPMEEEEEEEADQIIAQEEVDVPDAPAPVEELSVVQPVLDVIDESAEAINAAVDAAIETAKAITEADAPPEPAAEAPAAELPVEDTPVELPKES